MIYVCGGLYREYRSLDTNFTIIDGPMEELDAVRKWRTLSVQYIDDPSVKFELVAETDLERWKRLHT